MKSYSLLASVECSSHHYFISCHPTRWS